MVKNASGPTSDQEVEILLKEYEALRAEIISRLEAQTQLVSVTSVLIGGVIAAAPFVFSFGPQKQSLNLPPLILITSLLAISTLFTSLFWTYLEHDTQMAYIGQYFNTSIRPKLLQLLNENNNTDLFLGWDRFRSKQMGLGGTLTHNPITIGSVTLLSASRYMLISMPIVFSLVATFISYTYLVMWNIGAVFDLIFFIIDVIYFLLALLQALQVRKLYKELPSPTKTAIDAINTNLWQENARLTFNHVVNDMLQDMIDGHFKFYKQVNDDPEFEKTFLDWLFERYLHNSKKE